MFRIFSIALILIFSICSGAIVDRYPPLTPEQKDSFYQHLHNILNHQRLNLAKIEQNSHKMLGNPSLRLRFERLTGDLQAKEVLVSNFINNEKLRSPAVRKGLVEVLEQIPVSEASLIRFQQLVDYENSIPGPPPAPTPTPPTDNM